MTHLLVHKVGNGKKNLHTAVDVAAVAEIVHTGVTGPVTWH